MKNYIVELSSQGSNSFRCQKAADALDIDIKKKLTHKLEINADIETDFSIGLILGASGSGKTSLAKHLYGSDCFKSFLDLSQPIIDQFPDHLTYDDCSNLLNSVGLSSVPCWIRPANTLSNGQKARAEIALALASEDEMLIVDEWTSVVDRTIAKIMSHSLSKSIRKHAKKKIVLLSCHYDVIEWLNPDWIIDCNKQTFENRRSLWQNYQRNERLNFDIKETNGKEWKFFSKFHYLSDRLPMGFNFHFGLFHHNEQIGYLNFANYQPKRPNKPIVFHFNRLVIHPDFVGLGLGIKFLNECTKLMKQKKDCEIFGAFSSLPVYKALKKDSSWQLQSIRRPTKVQKGKMIKSIFRINVTMFSFKHVGKS